jgi:hypothetical protein
MKSDEDFFRKDEGPGDDGQRLLAAEVIGRVFLWVADAKTLDECGFRSIVALACVRPDLFEGATLEDLGFRAGRQRQAVWKMRRNFRQTTGF